MPVFRYHSAQVRVHRDRYGMALVAYSGAIGDDAFALLRDRAIQAVAGSRALLVDVRGALLLRDKASRIELGTFVDDHNPPAAIIAPESAVVFWRSYSDRAADHGVIRAIFTKRDPAIEWLRLWSDPVDFDLGCHKRLKIPR